MPLSLPTSSEELKDSVESPYIFGFKPSNKSSSDPPHSALWSRMLACLALVAAIACGSDSSSPMAPLGEAVTLDIVPADVELSVGDSVQLLAVARDANGDAIELDAAIGWSSSDSSVAGVSSNGLVRAHTEGSASVRATVETNNQSLSGSAGVDISSPGSGTGSQDQFKAFPEAEGWGAMALTQCDRRDIQVLPVTNLQDSGPGSLRDALSRVDPHVLSVIIFRVAGYINVRSRIEVDGRSCLYIAGQSAPGDGISIRGNGGQTFWFRERTHDVAIRYLRLRGGVSDVGHKIGLLVGTGDRFITDHLSLSWTAGQLMAVFKYDDSWGPLANHTIQRTLFAESLLPVPTCSGTKGRVLPEDAGPDGVPLWYDVQNISIHHNAAIHCDHRSPAVTAGSIQIVNNVIYNWNQDAVSTARKTHADFIGNFFKRGPMNRSLDLDWGHEFSHIFWSNKPGGAKGSEPDGYVVIGNTNNIDQRAGPSWYLQGNVGPNDPTGALDDWAMTAKHKIDKPSKKNEPETSYDSILYPDIGRMPIEVAGVRLRRDSPLPSAPVPITIVSAQEAWQSLIVDENVGAHRRLDCSGAWVDMRDEVDRRVLNEARRGTGIRRGVLRDPAQVGGYPSLDPGTPCADSDNDGMPDEFERIYGLDHDNASDANGDPDGDGYSNIEEYLNGTNPR